ncbi:hypothetical protein LOAG_12057 [Loa loa]|uniref:Uncharacterized protein n=1 Tax=Loa loa TaxID=7209 RepID=A0A1S0TLX8_LOALO|nr:hypothetical protein LOAG_12057 [Loa loa]EFO16451.1 hypothetical protein LOAG_12057 [Loa loa]
MEDYCSPKIVLYGEEAIGFRKRIPKRRYEDVLKQHLSLGYVNCHQWFTLASNRETAVTVHQNQPGGQKTTQKKPCLVNKKTFRCAFCNETCLSCIGIFSHDTSATSKGIAFHISSFAKT